MRKILFFVSCIAGLLTSCSPPAHVEAGPTKTEEVALDLGKTDRANIELKLGSGELNVNGQGSKLLIAQLSYNNPELKPEVRSEVNGSHAVINIHQPSHNGFGNAHSRWDLKLNEGTVLWDIDLDCGAGKAQLGLGTLNLRTVNVHIGVGQVDLDLEGNPKRDYDVNVSGGVGQANIHLPKGVGVRAEAHGGIGSVDVSGLEKKGDHWENDLYDKAKANVHLKVEGGIGEIRIIG